MRFATFSQKNQDYLCPEPLIQSTHPSLQPISQINALPLQPLNSNYSYNKPLREFLVGRHLLLDELPFPIHLIQEHYQQGFITFEKGITNKGNRYSCERCGNDAQDLFAAFHCYRCKNECTYCRNCIMMGRVSQCTPLIRWIGPDEDNRMTGDKVLNWKGELSSLQKQASKRITEVIDVPQELLIWAVCGAGKTEILFEGIEQAVRQGKRVCLATPRTDVVTELTPRFEKAFPSLDVHAVYGGSHPVEKPSLLTLSTTHQLFRYKNAFDVMIVDEVDAFPYSFDPALQFAVEKACSEHASRIYLTATPSKSMLKEVRRGELEVIHISRRFHGYPLPVPRFMWCGNWQKSIKKGRLPRAVSTWINEKMKHRRQCFLFVPTVQNLLELSEWMKDRKGVESVHAGDPERLEKVQRFRKGEISLLITTTILERGVTVPEIDVAVVGSDHEVFTTNALMQIAGRVGRSIQDPYGEVVYFHYGKTKAMGDAKRTIEAQNKRTSEPQL
ncbi:DEAD/DEAH box helicase [Pseudalkalibacillus sp. SCS-8]|uniref:DEAD/DEAH box helicase n=1 Tax=Pseudalkalibacillus nanhaiensis TaxID=3115291 RepID=UPI0032DAB683